MATSWDGYPTNKNMPRMGHVQIDNKVYESRELEHSRRSSLFCHFELHILLCRSL